MEKQESKKELYTKLVIYAVVFVLFCFIFYFLVKPNQDDYNYQVYDIYTNDWFPDNFYRHNNLFRYILDAFHFFNFDLRISASIILSLFVLARYIFFTRLQINTNILKKSLLSLALCIMMPINFGQVGDTYLGVFGSNIWHNAPYIAMMTFAPMCAFYFIDIFIKQNDSKKNRTILSITIFLCCLSKPNFVIAFIPACGLFFLVDYIAFHKDIKRMISNIKNGLLICIPTIIWLLINYICEFGGDKHILISFLEIWSYYAKRKLFISLNFIKTFLLSFVLLFLTYKNQRKRSIFYIILLAVGVFFFSFFIESFKPLDANFSWTYSSCGLVFNSLILIDFYNENNRINRVFKYIIAIILVLQCFTSIRYIYALANSIIRF